MWQEVCADLGIQLENTEDPAAEPQIIHTLKR